MPRINSTAISRRIVSAVSVGFLLVVLPLFNSRSNVQGQEIRTITVDKLQPAQLPKIGKPDRAAKEKAAPGVSSPDLFCDWSILVLLDDVKGVRVVAFNGPHNSTVNFTTTQTVSGILGVSHSVTGPFVASIDVPVPLDGNGNGQSEIFFVQGLQVGDTVLYATSVEMGPTTTLDYEVIPQCNCPPIPIVP